MGTITKDLGIATAYGYAVSKGYTGTEEEFAILMASYATVAEEATESASEAAESASAAGTSATSAAESATSASASATIAGTAASTATTKAGEASASASTASTAATTATTKASEASQSATNAAASATAAGNAQTAAETAQGKAEDAQEAAEQAQEAAEEAAASLVLDTTLTQAGQAAQAKAVGDAVADLKSAIDKTRSYTGYVEDYIAMCTTAGAIQASDGAPYANSTQVTDNYKYSPFIPIKSGEKISYRLRTPSTYCMIAFYTSAQTSGYASASSLVGTGGGTSGTFTAPSDGFVRITSRNDLADKYAIYSVNGQIQRIDGLVATNAQNIDALQKGLINAVEVGYVANEYVNQFNGSFTAYTGWNRTKYINVPPTATMAVNGVTRTSIYNYFYKADFTPLSRFDLALGDNTVTVPSQAKYYVLSTTDDDLANIKVKNPALYNYGDSTTNTNAYLKIASWNVGLFNNGINAPSTAESPQKMIDFRKIIGSIDAHVINTDEYRQYFDAENTILATPNVISFKYPYNTQGTQVSGNVSFSKADISNATKKVFDSGSGKYFIWYEVNVNGKKVTVINAHLAIEEDPTVHRNSEIQELITFMSGKQYVILTGDFNVASQAEYNAFKTAGYTLCNGGDFGWFNTWPIRSNIPDGWQTTWPCENLDNIIVSSDITPQYVEMINCNISDHAPLVAELRIN